MSEKTYSETHIDFCSRCEVDKECFKHIMTDYCIECLQKEYAEGVEKIRADAINQTEVVE